MWFSVKLKWQKTFHSRVTFLHVFLQRKKRASQRSEWLMENQRKWGNLEPFIPASSWLHSRGGFKRRSIWLCRSGPSWQLLWALRKHRWVRPNLNIPSPKNMKSGEIFEIHFTWLYLYTLGQDLVSKPPLQVQEVVEKWRNSPRATCCFKRVAPLRFSSNSCLGFSTNSESEQCQPGFTSEQQSPQHECAFVVFDQLLLVLHHELYDASAAFGSASPQLCHKRWDDILKRTLLGFFLF